jgi:hypothetical protein
MPLSTKGVVATLVLALALIAAPGVARAAHGGGGGHHGGGGFGGGFHGHGPGGFGHHGFHHGPHVFVDGGFFFGDPFYGEYDPFYDSYDYPYGYNPYPYPYPYPYYPYPPYYPGTEAGMEPPATQATPPAPENNESYGLVQLRGVPDGAAIDLDGRFWLTASGVDERWLALPAGRHTLTVRSEDAAPVTRQVNIGAGRQRVVDFTGRQ